MCIDDTAKDDLMNTELLPTIEPAPVNTLFIKMIQLSLTGNSAKIHSNVKIFKNQPSLQSLCSLVPNQPAPKKDKKGEFQFNFSGKDNNNYSAGDPYESPNILYALESIFENRPSTLFFQYLPQCGKIRDIYRVK